MKRCPYCAEKIQNEAVVCRWCGKDLPPVSTELQSAAHEPQKTPSRLLQIWLVILTVAFSLVSCLGVATFALAAFAAKEDLKQGCDYSELSGTCFEFTQADYADWKLSATSGTFIPICVGVVGFFLSWKLYHKARNIISLIISLLLGFLILFSALNVLFNYAWAAG